MYIYIYIYIYIFVRHTTSQLRVSNKCMQSNPGQRLPDLSSPGDFGKSEVGASVADWLGPAFSFCSCICVCVLLYVSLLFCAVLVLLFDRFVFSPLFVLRQVGRSRPSWIASHRSRIKVNALFCMMYNWTWKRV